MATEPVESVDALGLLCPLPILRVAAAVRRAAAGDLVELIGDDPGILDDLPAWCEGEGHALVSLEQREGGRIAALVTKGGEEGP